MQNNLNNHGLYKITQNIFLLNDENKVLILQHKSGKWLLPGGRLEAGENLLQGLKREVEEEISIKDFVVDSIFQVDTWEYKGSSYFGIFYTGRLETEEIKLSEEHLDYKWIKNITEVDSLDFWNNDLKDRIIKFLRSK